MFHNPFRSPLHPRNGVRRAAAMIPLLLASLVPPGGSFAAEEEPQAEIDDRVERVIRKVEKIRGLEFKRPISARNQSAADFEKYLDRQISKEISPERARHYGKVARRVGLYRGPEIQDVEGMFKNVMTSQAAAYYDPETHTFFVLMSGIRGIALEGLYAHELYHGMQDQYFNLLEYYLSPEEVDVNEDAQLARQCVVEGEAMYIMTLYTMMSAGGSASVDRDIMSPIIRMQADMSVDQMKEQIEMASAMSDEFADVMDSVEALDDLPLFAIETLMGAYLKGQWFVYRIESEHGWEKVARLYSDPPVSTEQILHPEKWLKGEKPRVVSWPDFETDPALEGWETIYRNVMGEVQMRIIFSEHELPGLSKEASAGWDGDAYAVLKRKDSDETALLFHTCWDDEIEAGEFLAAYEDMLKVKYPTGTEENVSVVQLGDRVLIIEGGDAASHERFKDFIARSKAAPMAR